MEGSELSHRSVRTTSWMTVLGFAAVMALCLFLRCYQLKNEEPWADEIVTLAQLNHSSLTEFLRNARIHDPNMSLTFCVIEYGWSRVFGISDLAVRPLPVILSCGSVPLVYLIAASFYGPPAGLLSAAIFSLSYICIYYGQEIRTYSLVGLLSLASVYSFMAALARGQHRIWALHYLINLLIAFSHAFALFLFVVEWLFLVIFRRRRILEWTVVHAFISVALGAWLFLGSVNKMVHMATWIAPSGLRDIAMLIPNLAAGQMDLNCFVWPYNQPHNVAVAFIPLSIAAIFLLRQFFPSREHAIAGGWTRREAATFLVLWLVVPPLALFLTSVFLAPCFLARYVLYSIFPLFILMGAGATSIRRLTPVLSGTMLAVYGYLVLPVFIEPFRHTTWREAAEYLEEEVAPSERVLIDADCFDFSAISYLAQPILDVSRPQVAYLKDTAETLRCLKSPKMEGVTAWIIAPTYQYSILRPIDTFIKDRNLRVTRRMFGPQDSGLYIYRIQKRV